MIFFCGKWRRRRRSWGPPSSLPRAISPSYPPKAGREGEETMGIKVKIEKEEDRAARKRSRKRKTTCVGHKPTQALHFPPLKQASLF